MSASGRIHATIGNQDAKIRVLYINPNSSISMTNESAEYFKDKIAPDLRLDFYTAPETAPPSIDGTHDGILSTAVVLQDLGLNSRLEEERSDFLPVTYDTIIVGCFSAHPLLPALQECLPLTPKTPPVLGIMESAIYTALQLAPAFGIVTTGFSGLFRPVRHSSR
jgi:Asp/Glu/hydantoin racemase